VGWDGTGDGDGDGDVCRSVAPVWFAIPLRRSVFLCDALRRTVMLVCCAVSLRR